MATATDDDSDKKPAKTKDSEIKKEIIQMASDKEGGTENGIESLTQINIVINDYSELRELMINALKKKVSSLSKKIIKNKSIKER